MNMRCRRRQKCFLSSCLMVCGLHPTTFAFALMVCHRRPCIKTKNVFSPTSSINHGHSIVTITTALSMARGGVHGKKSRMINSTTTKKKKTRNSNTPDKPHRASKQDRISGSDNVKKLLDKTQSSTKTLANPKLTIVGDTKKNAPPWQVLGKQDMKKNVEAEIIRRERIKLGIDSTSAGNTATKEFFRADVSGANQLISTANRIMLKWKRFNPSAPTDLTLVGAYLEKRLPPSLGVPEVAFLGRSNVGKSSLLNKLVVKAGGDTARVGKTPGATAAVNLYALLGQPKRGSGGTVGTGLGGAKPILGFADLPGFGFAKLSKEVKGSVEDTAEIYLGKRRELALGILLVDSRRVPTQDDRAVLAALFDMGLPLIVVATKCDKLKATEVESAMADIRDGLGLPDGQPLRISCITGEGIRALWEIILDACESRVQELKLAIEEGRDDGGVMRMSLDEDDGNSDFYDDIDDEDGDEGGYFDDGEDLVYDQGYDWVQSSGHPRVGTDMMEDIRDDFYDGDHFIEDDDIIKETQRRDRTEKESFKLRYLKRRVDEMEKLGEI